MIQQGILTAMADIVISDWGEDRAVRIHRMSPFAETLDSPRSPKRDEWFKAYFGRRVGVLLACIVDCAYRMDVVLTAPSPAGVSVVEYHILRPMLEYTYRLFDLVQLEIGVRDREQRAIENWYSDYRQFSRVAQNNQPEGYGSYYAKWEPVLTAWYAELTGNPKIPDINVRNIFDRAGIPESWWPTDLGGKLVNPAYQSGYGLFSAVEHGNLWAVQGYSMHDPVGISLDRPGLDDQTLRKLASIAGTYLLCSYGSVSQFVGIGVNSSVMNKLESCLDVIRQLPGTIDQPDEMSTNR